MKAFLVTLVLAAALGRCGAPPPAGGDLLGGPVPEDAAREKAACEDRGGRWGRGGMAGFYICYETTPDGGQSCTKGSDCDGLCLAKSRTCAPVRPLFGCNRILDDSGREQALCVD